MAFYYTSILSIVPLGIAYLAAAFLFAGIWLLSRWAPKRVLIRVSAAALLLLLPVSEELWIALKFGQACKEAGTFINKKVSVDGFYDDTRSTHAGEPTQQATESFDKSGYRFLEMKGPKGGVVRIEKSDGRWSSRMLDHPTARYHYKWNHGAEVVSHKIGKTESVVVDTQTGELIARYTAFGRSPPWFFVGMDTPAYACDAPGRWPFARGNPLVYREALIPAGQR